MSLSDVKGQHSWHKGTQDYPLLDIIVVYLRGHPVRLQQASCPRGNFLGRTGCNICNFDRGQRPLGKATRDGGEMPKALPFGKMITCKCGYHQAASALNSISEITGVYSASSLEKTTTIFTTAIN